MQFETAAAVSIAICTYVLRMRIIMILASGDGTWVGVCGQGS